MNANAHVHLQRALSAANAAAGYSLADVSNAGLAQLEVAAREVSMAATGLQQRVQQVRAAREAAPPAANEGQRAGGGGNR